MRVVRRGMRLAILALLIGGIHAASAQRPQERKGFWFGFGAGYGSLGCDDCDGREGSGTGYLKLGGTVSPKVLIGFEANSWVKKEDDVTLSISNGSAVVYFYPSAAGGFHLKGGLGLAVARVDLDVGGGTFTVDDTGAGRTAGPGLRCANRAQRLAGSLRQFSGCHLLGERREEHLQLLPARARADHPLSQSGLPLDARVPG